MVYRVINEWADGSRYETAVNTDVSRGRYLLAAGAGYPRMNKKAIPYGYQYETTSANTGKAGRCITTVTLKPGWV